MYLDSDANYMGIKDYVKFVRTNYSASCRKHWYSRYTDLYVDVNHILHHVCYTSQTTDEILKKLRSYLMELIATYRPTKRIYIAADGTAPIAKMLLQRKRRYEKVKTLSKVDELKMSQNLALNFTPGTEFMLGLANELQYFKSFIEITYAVKVILDIESVDEGEIKVRRQIGKDCARKNFRGAVYSGDADMILLLVSLETQHLQNIYQIVNRDTVISLGQLITAHKEKYCPDSEVTDQAVRNDFIFLNLLLGNDYLPKVSYLKPENIWTAYSKLIRKYEDGLVSYDKAKRTITIDQMFMTDLIFAASSMNKLNYDKKFTFATNNASLNREYVEGLAWCFDMYSTGVCSDYRYFYKHKSAPHYNALALEVMTNNFHQVASSEPVDTQLYGILLIPEKADTLLTESQREISNTLTDTHPIIHEVERCQKCTVFSKKLSKLNKEIKELRTESPASDQDTCDPFDDDSSDDSDDSAMSEETKAQQREDLLEKVRNTSELFNAHRETHNVMNIRHIESIEESYRALA